MASSSPYGLCGHRQLNLTSNREKVKSSLKVGRRTMDPEVRALAECWRDLTERT
jgi:hypothetical protein